MSYRGTQKINNKVYVYEAIARWNPEKQRSEQTRIYIGTKDPDTGEFIPNKKYFELYPDDDNVSAGIRKAEPKETLVMKSSDFGNVYLMMQAAEKSGLQETLQECFPSNWEDILSCAMHCCSENEALYLCECWAGNSYGVAAPSSQRITELLRHLDEDSRMNFYRKWAALRSEKEYLALDISSVSSWSELINYVECGYNRDHEKLPQINLAMLFGEDSHLPVFSRVYPGSVKDVSTLTGMVTFIEQLDLKQMRFVMDKGFYSLPALRLLMKKYIKFAVGVPFTTNAAKELVDAHGAGIESPANAIGVDGHIYYKTTVRDTIDGRRVYYHLYFDRERQLNESNALMRKVISLENDLMIGKVKISDPMAKYYFSFQKTKDGTYNIHRREDVINEKLKYSGYFLILTNESRDAQRILEAYRTKDVVEKSFDNIKNDLDLKRLRIHTDETMEGRIFIGFLSLVITSYIRNRMREKNLYKSYSFNSLFAELKKLRVIEFKNGRKLLTELTASHKEIYAAMGVKPPTASSI